jgi:hypothetical protein
MECEAECAASKDAIKASGEKRKGFDEAAGCRRVPMNQRYEVMSGVALAAVLILSALTGASGTYRSLKRDGYHSPHLLIRPYLARTGATVPKLGQPQTGRQTAQEKKAQEQSDKILNSICSNC